MQTLNGYQFRHPIYMSIALQEILNLMDVVVTGDEVKRGKPEPLELHNDKRGLVGVCSSIGG